MTRGRLISISQSAALGGVGLGFITPDQDEGRFFLRMREGARIESRDAVMSRVTRYAEQSGLEVTLLAGQYELMGQLGKLIASPVEDFANDRVLSRGTDVEGKEKVDGERFRRQAGDRLSSWPDLILELLQKLPLAVVRRKCSPSTFSSRSTSGNRRWSRM